MESPTLYICVLFKEGAQQLGNLTLKCSISGTDVTSILHFGLCIVQLAQGTAAHFVSKK
jgi:hypothetical protein